LHVVVVSSIANYRILQILVVSKSQSILLEAAPWYFSRRLLASKLRDQRNSINHDLISGKSIQHGSLGIYTLLTLIYAAIHTLDQILKNRVVPTSQFFSLSFFTSMCRSTDA
jgi:hypothetical protein